MNLAHLLLRIARMAPQRAAIFSADQLCATHAQWAARSARLAGHFRAAGLQPGDRVALFMRNHPRYLEVLFGAWWAGLVVVPINAKLHLREAQWIVDNAQARWIFVTPDNAGSDAESFQRIDQRAGRHCVRRADVPWRWPVRHCAPDGGRPARRPGLRQL